MAATNLTIDPDRLWNDLMETAAFGATAGGGLCRLTLSEDDRKVRDWFAAKAREFGCKLDIDDMGVMVARREGQRRDIAPIAIGSHLDTQPTGGRFDGALGVLAALEAVRTLHRAGYETFAPIAIVNWTNEEGARFAPAMLASGVFGGVFTRDFALAREDRDGVRFGEALDAIGYRGSVPCGSQKFSAFFELHIEQGPILEAQGEAIGVVTGVQGIRWYEVTITGQPAHTGTTPMTLRKNALVGAARLIEAVTTIAQTFAPHAVGTVGRLEVRPNSPNVIPGEVFLTVDIRHPEADALEHMGQELEAAVPRICAPLRLSAGMTRILEQPPVRFDAACVAAVRAAAAQGGFTTRDMVSGAGHDAAYVARAVPAAMIFVPCREGISHNEAEFASKEQCAAGAQVLLQAVLDYDKLLAERHGATARR